MAQIGRIAATAVLDINPFEQSTRVLETRIRSVDNAMKAQEIVIKNSGRSINGLKANYNLTGKSITTYNQILVKQKEHYEKLKASIGDISEATVQQKTDLLSAEAAMNKTVAQVETLTGKYNALGKEIAIQDSNWTKIGNGLDGIGKKAVSVGDGLSSFGRKWTMGVTAPIVAGVGFAVKAAVDFESAFAGTKKTVDELVDSNGNVIISYDDLAQGIRNMSKELPASASEIAAVAEAAGQLGIKTENVLSFSKVMIDLGESTNMNAETAATSLARLANITKMPQDEFTNLGSSLVELGNNFATTESEITAMTLRLAGAGSQVGMSEADILGLAAALSSVGIEAEMGGSAFSKVIVEMQLASEKGGQKLEDFANIAGMSAEQFSTAFKEDAVGAIGAFVDGLGKAEEKGTSAITMLDEMGISEVRLRDALLRAGGASELFGRAVETSNKAWGENTALTDEANKRYETTESKLKLLKNQVNDVAIEFGGPFVDALRDGLTALKPTIEHLAKLAKSFSNASPETQKMIMKVIGFTAVIGPAASVLGKFLKIGGSGLSVLGNLAKYLGKVSGNAKASKTALELASSGLVKMASGASTAEAGLAGVATKSGGLISSLGLLNPWVLGTTAVVVAGVAVWELWGKEVYNSSKRVQRWGTDVGEVTDKALIDIQGNTQKATGQFDLMSEGLSVNSTEMAGNFAKIGESIENNLVNKIKGLDKLLKELPENFDAATKKTIEDLKTDTEKSLEIVQQNNERISEIRRKAAIEDRELNVSEAKIIQSLSRDTTTEYINSLDVSAKEKKKILSAMTGDVANASKEEAKLWAQSLGEQRQASQEHARKSNEERRKYLKDEVQLDPDGEIGQMYLKAWDEINKTTTDGFDAQLALIAKKYPELVGEVWFVNGQLIHETTDGIDVAMRKSNEAIIENAENLSNRLSSNAKKNAETSAWTADEFGRSGKKAAQLWNDLKLIDKEGNIKSNAAEIVTEATKDVTTWNGMRMVIHDADLDSNAKLIIGEAAIANGWWDGMAWEDKAAILGSNSSEVVVKALRSSLKWNDMSFEEKKAILYSNTPEVMIKTLSDLGLWEEMEPTIKNLGADNFEFIDAIVRSEGELTRFNEYNPTLKKLLIDGSEKLNAEEAAKAVNEFNELPEEIKTLVLKSDYYQGKILESIKTTEEYNALIPPEKILDANNTNAVNNTKSAKQTIVDYNGLGIPTKNIELGADTIGAEIAKAAIDGIPDNIEKTITVRAIGANLTSSVASAVASAVGRYEKGTNYHSKGDALVNDQKGSVYEEAVKFPNSGWFVPRGRNVLIPDMPSGTKVMPANMTRKLLKYENGTGIDFSKTRISKVMGSITEQEELKNDSKDTSISVKLDKLILLLQKSILQPQTAQTGGVVILENKKEVGYWVADAVKEKNARTDRTARRMRGDR